MNGKDLMGCWTEAGVAPDATFLALPFLTAE